MHTTTQALERELENYRPQVADILAGLEAIAGGRVPSSYAVTRVLLGSGYAERNPARHQVAGGEEVAGGRHVARCACGWRSPACAARADENGDEYDAELWALAAVDVHAAAENAAVPLYVFTPAGERFAAQARRFGMPRR